MKTNTLITLWHYKNGEEFPDKAVYDAHSYLKKSVSRNRITEKGFYCTDVCTIRIPADEEIQVATGDYIKIGKHTEEIPDRRNAMRIIEVTDNRKGTSPHYKIVAGG